MEKLKTIVSKIMREDKKKAKQLNQELDKEQEFMEIKSKLKKQGSFGPSILSHREYIGETYDDLIVNNKINVIIGFAGSGKTRTIKKYIADNQFNKYVYISRDSQPTYYDEYKTNPNLFIYYDHVEHNADIDILLGENLRMMDHSANSVISTELYNFITSNISNISQDKKNILIIEDFEDLNIVETILAQCKDKFDHIIITFQNYKYLDIDYNDVEFYISDNISQKDYYIIPVKSIKERKL